MRHWVYVKFPKSGLGNLLLIWARAKVFSHLNGYPLVTSRWWGVRWGSWIRNEQRKRMYWGYFRESSLRQKLAIHFLKKRRSIVYEPWPTERLRPTKPVLFFFKETVVQSDLFGGLREHRDFIRAELLMLLKPGLQRQFEKLDKPEIGIHIRRGDFKLGNPITPDAFFLNCIHFIRATINRNLRVTVFTDAAPEELKEILALEKVVLARNKPDILDILEMSRSRILVLSQSSTFSYWAAFLSDAIVIRPEGDWQADIRSLEINQRRFEGKISFDNPVSLTGLARALKQESWEIN